MKVKLKPLAEQVIVITGASSGIGLATAYEAAKRGAKVVLAARNKDALDQAVAIIVARGGSAMAVRTDVSDRAQVESLAAAAISAHGRFDTWVNNAAVGIYGRLDVVPENEQRRLFDVNYWGTVNGSRVAVAHLQERGGALINLGSILSDVSVPLQGPYCASKAAVRGFTDALRVELQQSRAPVSVSLIKPAAIATPFAQHARNHMDREPTLPPPLYAPEDAAAAILQAAEMGGRDLPVGGGARAILAAGKIIPAAVDTGSVLLGTVVQKTRRAPERPQGNLFEPGEGGQIRGQVSYPVMRAGVRMPGTRSSGMRSPGRGGVATVLALALTGAALLRRRG